MILTFNHLRAVTLQLSHCGQVVEGKWRGQVTLVNDINMKTICGGGLTPLTHDDDNDDYDGGGGGDDIDD